MRGVQVLITTWFGLDEVGGVSTHIECLIKKLMEQHVPFDVLSGLGRRGPLVKALAAGASFGSMDRYRSTAIRWAMASARTTIRKAVSRGGIDLAHSHDIYSGFAALEAVRGSGVPVVLTLHGPALSEALMVSSATKGSRVERIIRQIEGSAVRGSHHVVGVDSGMGEFAKSLGAERVSVIPNAVPARECDEDESENPLFILVPRRLVPKTGVEFGVRAFA